MIDVLNSFDRAAIAAARDRFFAPVGQRPVLMGIVNVTPDSFSDGGLFVSSEAALAQAQAVLKNRYGDCKDHVVLLEALLAAVGIPSSAALVNSGNAYSMPAIGVVSPLNHVITYVPGTRTTVAVRGTDKVTIPGLPFAQLVFSMWFGPKPPSEALKKGMLGIK